MKSKLLQDAASAIRGLQEENVKLASEKASMESAIKLVFQLYKQGSVSAENLEDLYIDLCGKTDSELIILEKAAELHTNEIINFGKIGEKPEASGYDPLTRLLLEDW